MAPIKKKLYSEEALMQAMEEVRSKTLTIVAASLKYNIPKSTIGDRLTGKYGVKKDRSGNRFLFLFFNCFYDI